MRSRVLLWLLLLEKFVEIWRLFEVVVVEDVQSGRIVQIFEDVLNDVRFQLEGVLIGPGFKDLFDFVVLRWNGCFAWKYEIKYERVQFG